MSEASESVSIRSPELLSPEVFQLQRNISFNNIGEVPTSPVLGNRDSSVNKPDKISAFVALHPCEGKDTNI